MFFSVILPIYNVEKYLRECVDSILGQTYTDFELILVDDGSKDLSGKICDEYAEKDSRVKVIHKENGGLSDARNVGTDAACGEYIVYIDSDDYVTTNEFLQDVKGKIDDCGSDIVLYKFSKLYDESGKIDECSFSLGFATEITDPDEFIYEMVKRDAYYGMAWIKAFRRELVVKNIIKFEKGLLGEDMDWYFGLVLCAETYSVIDKSYIAYRQRSGSITSTLKLKNLTDFVYIIEKWSEKIKNAEISDKKRAALMGALAKYYSNLLITYSRLGDKNKKQYKGRIKALSYLLDYSLSARPLQIKKYYKLAGFDGVILMLKIYDKIK